MSDKPKVSSQTLIQLLREIYPETSDADGKVTGAKLTASHKKALVNLSYSDELKEQERSVLSDIIWRLDPTLKIFCEVAFAVYRNKHEQVGRKFIVQAVKIIGDNKFLNPLGSENIFYEITSQFQAEGTPYLQILIRQLLEKFNKRRHSISAADIKANKGFNDKQRSSLTVKDLNALEASVLAIAALWCHSLGKVDSDGLINAYKLYKTSSIIGLDDANLVPNLAVFVAQQISRPDDREFVEIIDYFVQQENMWKSEVLQKNSEIQELKKYSTRIEQQKAQVSAELNASQENVIRLQEQLEELKQQIFSNQLEQKSERVHLRDDTEKLRAKSFNLLTEELYPLLTTSLKALKRETPIVEVAVDHIERANEQIEGAIKWFKR